MKKRSIPLVILILYSLLLIYVMVFKKLPLVTIGGVMLDFGGTHDGPANLIPFASIWPYLRGDNGFLIAFINIAGNIVLLIPVGFIIPFVYRKVTWKISLVIGVVTGLAIESTQALLHVGIFDIDDVLLNALGVLTGYWAFIIIVKKIRWTPAKVVTFTTTTIVIIAVALYCVGYGRKQRPVDTTTVAENTPVISGNSLKAGDSLAVMKQGPDPCGGTGGTGQIISISNDTIVIKGHNGANEIIKLNKHTTIKNSMGILPASALKTGQRVTVVIGLIAEDSRMASAVMVCNEKRPQAIK